MKLKNVKIGTTVRVKPKAFEQGGSLHILKHNPFSFGVVTDISVDDDIFVLLSPSGEEWFVSSSEVSKCEHRYFMDNRDCFVVRVIGDGDADDTFTGEVVAILVGTEYSLGYRSSDFDKAQFLPCLVSF